MPGFTPGLRAMTEPVQDAPAYQTKSAASAGVAATRRALAKNATLICISIVW